MTYPEIDDAFGHWLAGYIDGEGHFCAPYYAKRHGVVKAMVIIARANLLPYVRMIPNTKRRIMRAVMYLFLNRELGMSTGKACAQIAHAAVEANRISKPKMVEEWRLGGHCTKLVMLAETTDQLAATQHYLEERGFKTKLIIDEGRTEIAPFSPTALGVEVVDKDEPHTQATFSSFKTYRDLPKEKPKARRWSLP